MPAVSTFEWAPSVPVNRDEVGGNVLLNNSALPLGATHHALTSPLIKVQSLSKQCRETVVMFQACLAGSPGRIRIEGVLAFRCDIEPFVMVSNK